MITSLTQIDELNAVEQTITRLADLGLYGVIAVLGLVLVFGAMMVILQQRSTGKQAAVSAQSGERLTATLTKLIGSISERLEEAQDTKTVLTTVTQNQTAIIKAQEDQTKVIATIPEFIGLVDDAMKNVRETVASLIITYTGGAEDIRQRFDDLDMQNGEILKQLQRNTEQLEALNKNLLTWLDEQRRERNEQRLERAENLRETRKLNTAILEAFQEIATAVKRTTQETPVIELKHQKPSESEEQS